MRGGARSGWARLAGMVSALCGVAGGVVVVFGWVVLVAGLRTYVCGGGEGEGRVLAARA